MVDQNIKDMSPQELDIYIGHMVEYLEIAKTPDIGGIILILFEDSGKAHYTASITPQDAVMALRTLADKIESGEAGLRDLPTGGDDFGESLFDSGYN